MAHLLGAGGHGEDQAAVDAGLLAGPDQPRRGAVAEGVGTGGPLELVHRHGRDLAGENMGVHIDNHGKTYLSAWKFFTVSIPQN